MTASLPEPWRQNVGQRLINEFGVAEQELLQQVLMPSQSAARGYADNLFPRGGAGQVRHLHLVRNLSTVLQPRGYTRRDEDNVSRLVSPERRLALVVTSGDQGTGVPLSLAGRLPRTKYAKGPAMQAAVQRNAQLAFDILGDEVDQADLDAYMTWFLMVHVNKHEIRSELSRPNGVDPKGYVSDWVDRLILSPLPNDGSAIDIDIDIDDGEDGNGIDIPVEPR